MSLETTYKTEIVINPEWVRQKGNIRGQLCLEILRKAVEKAAADFGGIITDTYADCTGKEHRCLMAVRTGEFPQGIGVQIADDGHVTFVYDALLRDETNRAPAGRANSLVARQICNAIAQNYAAIAVLRVLKQNHFDVRTEETGKTPSIRRIIINARR